MAMASFRDWQELGTGAGCGDLDIECADDGASKLLNLHLNRSEKSNRLMAYGQGLASAPARPALH